MFTKKFIDVDCGNDYSAALHIAAKHGHVEVCELLILHKANVDPTDICGNTPLYYAVAGRDKMVAKLLLNKGASINAINLYHNTPLDCAIAVGAEDILNDLKDCNAQVSEFEDKLIKKVDFISI